MAASCAILALAEFEYQSLFYWSSDGKLVKWFVSGLLLLLILLQRPPSEFVFVGVPGWCEAAQELWQEAGGVGLVGINAAGWKTGFVVMEHFLLWPVCSYGPSFCKGHLLSLSSEDRLTWAVTLHTPWTWPQKEIWPKIRNMRMKKRN